MGDLSDHDRAEVKRLTGLLMELVRMEVVEEREACAKVCEKAESYDGLFRWHEVTKAIAKAIRNRGKK